MSSTISPQTPNYQPSSQTFPHTPTQSPTESPNQALQKVFTLPTSPTPPKRVSTNSKSSKRSTFDPKCFFLRSSKNFVRRTSRDCVPLCEDEMLLVCTYLSRKDLRSLSATSLRYRSITTSYQLHIGYILSHPFVPKVVDPYTPLTVRDDTSLSSSLFSLPQLHTPTSLHGLTADQVPPLVSFNMSPHSSPKTLFPNKSVPIDPPSMHLLTSLLIPQPTCIDPTTLSRCSFIQYSLHGKTVIQYTGTVGLGDRCMRSELPFPVVKPRRRANKMQHLIPNSPTLKPLLPLISAVSEIGKCTSGCRHINYGRYFNFLTSTKP
ncbi:hypothetical protein TrCOL_g11957 [Triparma columacea]|uniref:F-box domain-containing protein n=1 Tax=Triparma columacea TaxID=722753 RepID=A0A9W7FW28_9STRA|nr:hypothetical protein TrCOL_g11957 [Triparma columacea]